MRVINMIMPEDMDEGKSYRQALGYPWQDLENKIPGDDRIVEGTVCETRDKIYAELRKEFGTIIVSHSGPNPHHNNLIAIITGMWCGGASEYIYQFEDNGREEKIDSCPLTAEETASQEYALEEIHLMEQDDQHKNNPGYCTKCHSYCYGDCGAN